MQEKGVWNLTENAVASQRTAAVIEKAKESALKIILNIIDDDLFRTIEDIDDVKEIWNKLKVTFSQVD